MSVRTTSSPFRVVSLLVFASLLGAAATAWAQVGTPPPPTAGGGLPNFDVRIGKDGQAVRSLLAVPSSGGAQLGALHGSMNAAHQALKASVPGVVVEWHPTLTGAEVVTARGSFLTAPGAAGADAAVRAFIGGNASLFGLAQPQVASLVTTAEYANPAGNLSWVTLEQRLNGLPVFRAELRAAVTPAGEVASIVSELAPGLDGAMLGKPAMTAEQAIVAAAKNIGVPLAVAPSLVHASPDGLRQTFQRGPFADDITATASSSPARPSPSPSRP
jgi:hypothetical protein